MEHFGRVESRSSHILARRACRRCISTRATSTARTDGSAAAETSPRTRTTPPCAISSTMPFAKFATSTSRGRYEAYAKACDDYFIIRHRNRARGVGGIFFDNLRQDWQQDFAFVRETGEAFLEVFPKIVQARVNLPWSVEQRAQQLRVRGYYAEFNLVYDRGTRFGLLTQGNPDAVLMSLPPLAAW